MPNSKPDQKYLDWLESHSMLQSANSVCAELSADDSQWQYPFGESNCESVLDQHSTWLSLYADSIIGGVDQSVLETLSESKLLDALQQLGISAIHTGPLKLAGGISDQTYTDSIDGHFDRIEMHIDSTYGVDAQYQNLVAEANKRDIDIVDDLIPGHTGKGPDFRLAEFNQAPYPSLYTMFSIQSQHWHMLPTIAAGEDSVNLNQNQVEELRSLGYRLIGPMDAEVFARPGIKESCWSVTDETVGVDGIKRRWAYLHVFKQGQPSLNWSDPSFSAFRMQTGDLLHSLTELGTSGLRMDATMFLGVESSPGDLPSRLAGHPLSTRVTDLLAMQIRKYGGYSFQELNVGLEQIKASLKSGPEFSYDFSTRPAYLYALACQDAGPLRLILREMIAADIQPRRLVHGMQNHDELMLEATHFLLNSDKEFDYENNRIQGGKLFQQLSARVLEKCTGDGAEYNHPLAMSPGVCSTLSGFIAASIGIGDLHTMTEKEAQIIRKKHLLAAAYNALQPGIFNISAWDIVGALPLEQTQVAKLLADNDHRWINRGAYDLAGDHPENSRSLVGLPRANSLYGDLCSQLKDSNSFASQLKEMLHLHKQHHISSAFLLEVPTVSDAATILMHLRCEQTGAKYITALNFSDKTRHFDVSEDTDYKVIWSSLAIDESSKQVQVGELRPYEALLLSQSQ